MKTHLDFVSEFTYDERWAFCGLQTSFAMIPRIAYSNGELGSVAVESDGRNGVVEFRVLT